MTMRRDQDTANRRPPKKVTHYCSLQNRKAAAAAPFETLVWPQRGGVWASFCLVPSFNVFCFSLANRRVCSHFFASLFFLFAAAAACCCLSALSTSRDASVTDLPTPPRTLIASSLKPSPLFASFLVYFLRQSSTETDQVTEKAIRILVPELRVPACPQQAIDPARRE